MNIAEQAYQDGQEFRKAQGAQGAGEAVENRVMEAFTRTGLDFQHWQLYRANWFSGYHSVEDGSPAPTPAHAAEGTMSTLVLSSRRGRYALDDPQHGRDIESGDALALLLAGQWIEGSIAHAANLYASEYGPRLVASGYYFIARDGSVCGICAGMKVRVG